MSQVAPANSGTVSCMWCGEDIKAAAKICRFCNREQTAPESEYVIYEGEGHLPLNQLAFDLLFCLLLVGFITLTVHLMQYKSRRYRVTNKRVQFESGILSKKVEVMDLFRVQDIRYESSWGFGQVVLHSTDRTTPHLVL